MPGRVTDVAVNLKGVKLGFTADMDVLLVSPDGDASIVASDACGHKPTTGVLWVFSSFAGEPLSKDGSCGGGIYRPTDHVPNAFDAGADFWPQAPFSTLRHADLDRFVGEQPNGAWKLYVVDDRNFEGGRIASGWALTVTTEVPDAVVPGAGGSGAADPYPLTRAVSGVDGVITDVDVALAGIYHARPDDLDLTLAGPQGQQVKLMSKACGQVPVKGAAWVWDDQAGPQMPAQGPCPNGSAYVPTDNDPGKSLPEPAPAAPYSSSLSAFNYTDPNGEWRLYASDAVAGEQTGFSPSGSPCTSRRARRPTSGSSPARSRSPRARPGRSRSRAGPETCRRTRTRSERAR